MAPGLLPVPSTYVMNEAHTSNVYKVITTANQKGQDFTSAQHPLDHPRIRSPLGSKSGSVMSTASRSSPRISI